LLVGGAPHERQEKSRFVFATTGNFRRARYRVAIHFHTVTAGPSAFAGDDDTAATEEVVLKISAVEAGSRVDVGFGDSKFHRDWTSARGRVPEKGIGSGKSRLSTNKFKYLRSITLVLELPRK
jgi:hypothetical protein